MSEFLCCAQTGLHSIFLEDDEDENLTMPFFWRRKSKKHDELKDVSNFPLLAEEWRQREEDAYNTRSPWREQPRKLLCSQSDPHKTRDLYQTGSDIENKKSSSELRSEPIRNEQPRRRGEKVRREQRQPRNTTSVQPLASSTAYPTITYALPRSLAPHTKTSKVWNEQPFHREAVQTTRTNKPKAFRGQPSLKPRTYPPGYKPFEVHKDVAMAWMEMADGNDQFLASRSNRARNSEGSYLSRHRTGSTTNLRGENSSQPQERKDSHRHRRRSPPPAPLYPRQDWLYESHLILSRPITSYKTMVDWKSALDPQTGRTYYYNTKTRETQWRKPMELASEAERAEMEAKERKQREFFESMEQNILKSIAAGEVTLKSPKPGKVQRDSLKRPNLVRTISSMENAVLKDLVKRVPSHRSAVSMDRMNNSLKSLGRGYGQRNILSDIAESSKETHFDEFDEASSNLGLTADESKALADFASISEEMGMDESSAMDDGTLMGDSINMESFNTNPPNVLEFSLSSDFSMSDWKAADAEAKGKSDVRAGVEKKKPALMKRNTCGTLHVNNTMSAPDKDATIKCVCGVFRAHIVASDREEKESGAKYDHTKDGFRKFNDREKERKKVKSIEEEGEMSIEELALDDEENDVPSLDAITNFYRDVFKKAQMESDCIIMSLIYVERLIKVSDGLLRPRKSNWRSLLFSSMILSSKVWDDLSMWNADFSQTCPAGVHFSLQRINELELCVLNALKFKVKVPASEYAKYYFLLRSMVIKSGLGGENLATPLDVEGAKQLEQVSSGFQSMVATKRRIAKENALRSKSMGDADKLKLLRGAAQHANHASLEHMVQM